MKSVNYMNLSKSLQLLYLFFVVFFTVSCELINPAEEIPSYIYVDEFTLSTNLLEEGEKSHTGPRSSFGLLGQEVKEAMNKLHDELILGDHKTNLNKTS